MESKTIELVQDSFSKVAPIAATAATIFYNRLFELDPALKKLFPTDNTEAMEGQGNKLMTMLASCVAGLNNLDKLIPVLENLGRNHVGYHVEASHYDTVGTALIDTLTIGLEDAFTPEVKEAWIEVYTTMANVMKSAAYNEVV